MKSFRVGIDSYSLDPLALPPFEVLAWAKKHGCDGVQFTSMHLSPEKRGDPAFLKELAQAAREAGLYLEWGGGQHIPHDMNTWERRDLMPVNRAAAEQACALGVKVIRSCSGGLMRWKDDSPPTEELLTAMVVAMQDAKPMLMDLDVVLAVELHFEFTTFELLRVFERCGAAPGGCFGICLDTMNLLTMLEDPVSGTERILPWVVATHLKDGGMRLDREGLASFTAEAGTGQVDFEKIFALLSTLDRQVDLSLEDHGGSFHIPIFNGDFLARFPDLTVPELTGLINMALEGNQRIEEGSLAPLDRADWPAACEKRVANGIKNIKGLVKRLQD